MSDLLYSYGKFIVCAVVGSLLLIVAVCAYECWKVGREIDRDRRDN